VENFDALVVGGGPAGSACARRLRLAGMRVAVLDAVRFPRVKLCAGWVSPPVWDALELSPEHYPLGLWPWRRMRIHFAGDTHTLSSRGWFIRRWEFDDFLLRRSGVEVREQRVQRIERDGRDWVVDGGLRARFLVGAGGTNCPVARLLFPKKPRKPVATQEREFEAAPCEGMPEILVHADLGGYSWSIPKGGWRNVGCGTVEPRATLPAWKQARSLFDPAGTQVALDEMKGHTYHLFRGEQLATCWRDGAALAGDALGLAHPFTGEGILPAVTSGALCGEAIATGRDYRALLESHPLFQDYKVIAALTSLASRAAPQKQAAPRALGPVVARLFALAFSARPLPLRRVWQRRAHG
jgi:flavin-dependent dehydrogenase